MAAMDVVKAGARRQIGNGKDTKIWSIPWLPSEVNGCVTTELIHGPENTTVNSLMNIDGNGWDMDMIDSIFNNRDAELIKRVPIPMMDRQESWSWLLEDKGTFTVKSSYRWLQGDLEDGYHVFWKKLWNLKLPGKVAQFLWRVCKNCFPTAAALSVKQVVQTVQCPWCQYERETDNHVLFTCDFAKTVWYSAGLY